MKDSDPVRFRGGNVDLDDQIGVWVSPCHFRRELARAYKDAGMAAYSKVQQSEFAREEEGGYHAVKHQRFVGTGYLSM